MLLEEAIDVEFGELEGSLVHAFLLNPDHLGALVEGVHVVAQVADGEGCDLLQTHNPDAVS